MSLGSTALGAVGSLIPPKTSPASDDPYGASGSGTGDITADDDQGADLLDTLGLNSPEAKKAMPFIAFGLLVACAVAFGVKRS